MDDNQDDDCSDCSLDSLGSVDDVDDSDDSPNTLDLTSGDFSPINTQLFSVLAYNINSIVPLKKINLNQWLITSTLI